MNDVSGGAPRVSYAVVLRQPGLARITASALFSRTADSMWGVLVVLFALSHFHSPLLAGVAAAMSQIPNKLIAPIAGTLLDRHGRARLVLLDYVVAGSVLAVMGGLSWAGRLPEAAFIGLCTIVGFTSILSATGLRSLFPLLLPRTMWDRGNALDSASYVVAAMVGPALAGLLVGFGGGEIAVLADAAIFAAAAVVCIGIPDPPSLAGTAGSLWRAAWEGLVYVVRNPTLRALAFVLSALNVGYGAAIVAIPLLVLGRLGGSQALVGLLFTVFAFSGLCSGIVFGRIGSEGRERLFLFIGAFGFAAAVAVLATASAMPVVVAAMVLAGASNGPVDIGLFALRQRRTSTEMLGRAMAITMALNGAGMPVGSLIAGAVGRSSVAAAFWVAAVAVAVGASIVYVALPQ